MNPLTKAAIMALMGVAAGIAAAQDTTPKQAPNAPADAPRKPSTAQIDAGEPRADISPGSAGPTAAGPAATSPAGANPSATSPRDEAKGRQRAAAAASGASGASPSAAGTAQGVDGTSPLANAAATPVAGTKPSRRAAPSAPRGPGAVDRLNLGTATVTGDSEQPKVMYIVPWKKAGIGDLSGKPMNSLLDEALAPVDRDEFKREVAYYDAVKADASPNGGANPAAQQGEK